MIEIDTTRTTIYPARDAVLADHSARIIDVSPAYEGAGAKGHGLYRRIGKRVFDVSISSLMLLAAAPVIGGLAIAISLDGGKPFFVHKRVGEGGRMFGCLKLRSMVLDAEERLKALLAADPEARKEWDENQKLDRDPRVTKLGRILRKTSLDELPQLWNVLRGDMSLVGPRPVVTDELRRYGVHAETYMRMKPGVTGPWQATGRNDISYDERVRLDVDYERDVSLSADVRIVVMTALSVVNATGK